MEMRPASLCLTLLSIVACQGRLGAPPAATAPPTAEMPTSPPSIKANPTAITLPIEVLGPNGYTQSVSVFVDDPLGVDRLYLQVNRPAFRDGGVNTARKAKGSVRCNQAPWIDSADTTAGIEIGEPEKSYGGLSGGFHTVRFSLPVTGIVAGWNTLAFRFNETDGITMGYRVIDLNLLRKGAPVLRKARTCPKTLRNGGRNFLRRQTLLRVNACFDRLCCLTQEPRKT